MKKRLVIDIYFQGADDSDIGAFTSRFLEGGLFWIYIAINPERGWAHVYEKLPENKKPVFRNEYNRAFLFCNIYKELSKLFIGKALKPENLFLPAEAAILPEKFVKYERSDDSRWKEALELAA